MALLDGLHPFPTGWYVVAFSKDLAAGDVTTVTLCGEEVVLYRTAAGVAVAVDPFCPHLGAHLGHGGSVEGERIRCPFHGWAYEPSGSCVEIPGCSKIPKGSALSRRHLIEQDDVIAVFYTAEGYRGEPFPFPALGSDGFTPSQYITWTIRSHPQEVCENTVDMAHLFPVHSVEDAHVVKKHIDGSHMNVVLEFNAPGDLIGMPGEDNHVQLDVILHGLGRIVSRTHVKNRGVKARQAIYPTPIDGERMHLRGVVNTMATDDPDFTKELADLFYESFVDDFAKDFPIWENKRYLARPKLSAADGPIPVYRKWTRQFYPAATQPEPAAASMSSVAAVAEKAKARLPLLSSVVARVRGLVEARRSPPLSAPPESEAPESAPPESEAPDDATPPRAAKPKPKPAAEPTLRIASAQEYFDRLHERFDPTGAKGVDAIFQWRLSGDGAGDAEIVRHAVVQGGELTLCDGAHDKPTVTISMGAADYVRMVNRELDGAMAFTSGRAKLKGSIPMAMKMRNIFPQ